MTSMGFGPGPGETDEEPTQDEHELHIHTRTIDADENDDPLDPQHRKDERRAYVQRRGVTVLAITGDQYERLHGPTVAFLNAHHEKRVRKTSREWFRDATIETHDAPGCALFAAIVDGTVLGVSASKESGYAAGFTVTHPDYRRLGIGTKLVKAKLEKVPTYTTRVAVDNESCLYLMFKSGLVATTIATNDSNGKTVIRFETSNASKGTLPVGAKDPKKLKNTAAKWVVVSKLVLGEVAASAELMVAKAAEFHRDGAVTVHHGKQAVRYEATQRVDGKWLYRDEARGAKRKWAESQGLHLSTWAECLGAKK